ncbi:hypothetical protein [Telluria beijingensis]|uniref:hypothetical protein n=1 Tax=Telluria beijingensis TaxID=3068633 RepID=UPI002796293A|nr:hypothetical protein [Massilia sp. REN29]
MSKKETMHDYWFLPLENCSTLAEIGALWHDLLEERQMAPQNPVPHYQDAILQFAALCALPPQLKLGALLAYGSAFDVDLRLPLGLLHEAVLEADRPWPDAVAASVSDNGAMLALPGTDPWLGAFIAGRMAGLRETAVHDGVRPDDWTARFWDLFLEMACRHGDIGALRLALGHGADPLVLDGAAIAAAVADLELLACLLERDDERRPAILALAWRAAAAADKVDAFAWLAARGVQATRKGAPALAAAARHLALDAYDWLVAHGADPRAGGLLPAAAGSLDATMVERVLADGAGDPADAVPAFLAAFDSEPWELYAGEPRFFDLRVDMLALLLHHGVQPAADELAAVLRKAPGRRQVVQALLQRPDLAAPAAALLAAGLQAPTS